MDSSNLRFQACVHGVLVLLAVGSCTSFGTGSGEQKTAASVPASLDPPVEASTLGKEDLSDLAQWLDEHGQPPEVYLLEKCQEHQVVVLGETHAVQSNLVFLRDSIPHLYHQAGVTCIGLEVCNAEDNKKLKKLVTGQAYDRELALEIARSQNWGIWGFREYWDLLEAVWQLNDGLASQAKRMRVVGIDRRMNLRKVFEFKHHKSTCNFSAVAPHIRKALQRDELMARQIEEQIMEKGEKGVILVGAAHSPTHYTPSVFLGGRLQMKSPRMACLLHNRFGDKIHQIWLHSVFFSQSMVDSSYAGPEPVMTDVIEEAMKLRSDRPVGFDLYLSPLANLRDSGASYFHGRPETRLSDIARGYIYLVPKDNGKDCEWIEGFVSEEVFRDTREFLEDVYQREIRSAAQADSLLASGAKPVKRID